MKNKQTRIFFFFFYSVGVILAELYLFFDRHFTTDGGCAVCATPHTFVYRALCNITCSFFMVCRCTCGFRIIVNIIFATFFRLLNLAISVSLSDRIGQEWLELGSWNCMYSINMKNKQTRIFRFPLEFSLQSYSPLSTGIWPQTVGILHVQLLMNACAFWHYRHYREFIPPPPRSLLPPPPPHTHTHFLRLLNLAILGSITVGILCAQLLLQFHTDQFATLEAFLLWSVDVLVVLVLSSILFLSLSLLFNWVIVGA